MKTNTNTKRWLTALLAAVFCAAGMAGLMLAATESHAEGETAAYRGTAFTAEKDLTIDLGGQIPADADFLSFEYIITDTGSGATFPVMMGNWTDSYGYYNLGVDGEADNSPGVTCEKLEDGYVKITFEFEKLTKFNGSGNAPATIDLIYVWGLYNPCSGYIDNVTWDRVDFAMQEGASVRFASPAGLRFTAEISESKYDPDLTYGMIIAPEEYFLQNITGSYNSAHYHSIFEAVYGEGNFADLECEPYQRDGESGYFISGALVEIKDENLCRKFAAVAYIFDGEDYEYTYFSAAENSRSVADVARAALADTEAGYDAAQTGILEDFVAKSEASAAAAEAKEAETGDLIGALTYVSGNAQISREFDYGVKVGGDGGYSLKMSAPAGVGGWPGSKYELPETLDLSAADAFVSVNLRFSATAHVMFGCRLFDTEGNEVAVREINITLDENRCGVYRMQSGTFSGEEDFRLSSGCTAEDLKDVKYIEFYFDFDNGSKAYPSVGQAIWFDNLAIGEGA